jgi:hypothetical protein
MQRSIPLAVILTALTSAAFAQNELRFYDGTTEFTSRGGNSMEGKEVLVRIPGDQLWGATAITGVSAVIQDQNVSTAEPLNVVVRRNDNNAGPNGGPDPAAAGLIGSVGPFTPTFPTPGTGTISATVVTYNFSPPLPLPAPTGVMPNDDIYVGLAFTAPAPNWPMDGISCHMSGTSTSVNITAGEQMSATTPGYTGVPGQAGMAWEVVLTGVAAGFVATSTLNRAWNIGISFTDDILQPFADNPAIFTGSPFPPAGTGTGLNPNFGYAGIFPDELRPTGPDGFGYRLRSSSPAGSTAYLFVSFATLQPPISLLPIGWLSLDLNAMFPAPLLPFQQGTTNPAVFGPYPGIAGAAGAAIHAQCLTVSVSGGLRLSTIGTIRL